MSTLLIVDNNEFTRKHITEPLRNVGYTIIEAATGKTGLNLLHNNLVDLMIIEIFMPEMDGIEVIRKVAGNYKKCKLIAISGHNNTPIHNRILSSTKLLGANAVIITPFSSDDIIYNVKYLLRVDHYKSQ
ncbi:MAG: response regulator [Magnetococcus sp. YQC-5]